MSYLYAKFEENPCVGTDESTPFPISPRIFLSRLTQAAKAQAGLCIGIIST